MKTIIQTYAGNLNQLLAYYNTLNFEHLTSNDKQYAISSKFAIELNTNPHARPGLKLFADDSTETVTKLQAHLNVVTSDNDYLISTPSGCRVYLENEKTAPTVIFADQESVLGNFMGMTLETTDMDKSLLIWEILGFKLVMGKAEDGWVLLTNSEGFSVSLMAPNSCPHRCIVPSLTFFNNTKNSEIIAEIRRLKIPIVEEITAFNKEGIVDNIIVQDPGGLGFFIFND